VTTQIQPAALAEMDRVEALDYLKKRILKIDSICNELKRFEALTGTTQEDEVWDQNNILAGRCQVVLTQAMALFEDFGDFRTWCTQEDVDAPVRRHILPYSIVFETTEQKRYTAVFNWVGRGLERLPGQDRNNPPDEIEAIRKLQDKIYPKFQDSISHPKLYPAFFDGGRFRNFYLFNRVLEQRLKDQAGTIIHECLLNGASEDWVNTLSQYKRARPAYAAAFGAIMQKELGEFPYDGSQALRQHYYGSAIPPENECIYRSWEILTSLGKGQQVSWDSLDKTLRTIKHNEDFFQRKFPGLVLQSLQDFGTDDPANTDMTAINPEALNQYTEIIAEAGIGPSDMVHLAMTTVAKFSRDDLQQLGNLSDAQKMSLVMKEYEKAAQKHFSPDEEQKDAMLYLILKSVPENVLDAVAKTNDAGAVIAYSMTGDAKDLRGLKDLSRADRVFGSDLGL